MCIRDRVDCCRKGIIRELSHGWSVNPISKCQKKSHWIVDDIRLEVRSQLDRSSHRFSTVLFEDQTISLVEMGLVGLFPFDVRIELLVM